MEMKYGESVLININKPSKMSYETRQYMIKSLFMVNS